MLLPPRQQRKCELFLIKQYSFLCSVYTILCFLQNPALKVSLESSCKCRGRCAHLMCIHIRSADYM